MLLEENGFVEKETSSESPRRNGSSSNGTGRRRRPPPADFVPFDTSESTNVRRRNGGSVSNSEEKKSDILSLEKPVLMDWKDIPGLILIDFYFHLCYSKALVPIDTPFLNMTVLAA
jgi:hypothetical protein